MLTMEHPARTLGDNYGHCLHALCGRLTPRDINGLCEDHQPPAPTHDEVDMALRELARRYAGITTHRTTPTPRHRVITRDEHTRAVWMLATLTPYWRERITRPGGSVPRHAPWSEVHGSSYRFPTHMAGIAVAVARGEYTIREDTL